MVLCGYAPKPSRPPLEAAHPKEMGKKAAKVMEGRSQQQRIKVRKQLGSLKGLTVQPRTRERYQSRLDKFVDWLAGEGLTLPKRVQAMDAIVSDYLEFLWATGESKSTANNTLAALQDKEPGLKRRLAGSWRLLKAWSTAEVPRRAPPLTLLALDAMCGWFLMKEMPLVALSLRIAFFGLLRTGELLDLKAKDVFIPSPKGPAVLSLGLTKAGARQGAAESITLHEESVLGPLYRWKQRARPVDFLTPKAHAWRSLFADAIEALRLSPLEFRPYSLRRGGATFWFNQHGSFDRLLVQARWAASKTARIYLNDGLAQLADMTLPNSALHVYVKLFRSTPMLDGKSCTLPRTGGRGKRKVRKMRVVFFLHFS